MHRFTQQRGLIAAAGIALALAGCSEGDDDAEVEARASVDDNEVSVAVDPATAQLALNELSTNVDTTVTGFSDSAAHATANSGAGGAVAVRCLSGGDAMVDGYVNVVPLPVNVDVKVAITYNGCVTNSGTMIQGELDFSQTVAAGPGTPLRIETIYTGEVELTGRVNAKCPVDLNVLVDETGRAIQVSGEFCGQDATALSLQISPRWSTGR